MMMRARAKPIWYFCGAGAKDLCAIGAAGRLAGKRGRARDRESDDRFALKWSSRRLRRMMRMEAWSFMVLYCAQKRCNRRIRRNLWVMGAAVGAVLSGSAWGQELRVITYNIDDDTGGGTATSGTLARANMPDVAAIIQAIGQTHLAGNAQPVDVIALNELHYDNPSISSSLISLTTQLNNLYGAGTYAYDTFVGATNGNLTGNGPNGLIYNTKTVIDLGAVGLTVPLNGSSAARQPIRYELAPVGYETTAPFYLYSDHYKSGTADQGTTTNAARRNIEAQAVRANADALGSSAHVIYSGDFNLTGGKLTSAGPTVIASQEPAYLTLTASGNGQAVDPLNATGWDNTSAWTSTLTESGADLDARFDFQLVTNAMVNQPGMQIVPGSYQAIGNSSTMKFGKAVNLSTNTAALADLPNRTDILNLLSDETDVTDHLPVAADYRVVGVSASNRFYVGPASGTWNTTANWSGTDHGASGSSVPINTTPVTIDPSATTTVTLDTSYTGGGVGDVHIAGVNGATATLNQTGNTLNVAASVFLGDLANTKGTYSLSGGTIAMTGALNVGGSALASGGTATFSQSGGTATAAIVRVWSGGTVTIAGGTFAPAATVVSGGAVALAASDNLGAITMGSGSIAIQGTGKTVTATSLAMTSPAKFDVGADKLVVSYSGTSPAGSIRQLLVSGFNSGNWNGAGIDSSAAHADGTFQTALGYIDTGNSIVVKYTYYGDNNLDGVVNGTDFQMLLDGLAGTNASSWSQGDYTYDGQVDLGNDFNLFLIGYLMQGGALGELAPVILADGQLTNIQKSALLSAVPEPSAAMSVLVGGYVAAKSRRRRLAR
jgi:hypothetical protein